MTGSQTDTTRRRYDNRLRRERAEQTRERVVAAGAELVHEASVRDWRGVTIRAVAERAGVNERTVYRHFANERALRGAVMNRLEQEAGVDFTTLRLDGVAEAAARMFRYVSAYPLEGPRTLDPALVDVNRRQHDALRAAVAEHAERWPATDRTLAAATLDVLWALASYERLINDWQLDGDDAINAITWAIGLVEDAVRDGRRPSRSKVGRRRTQRKD
ncbi:MAG: helix-turn-helix domain-containing protein [Acidimicrobiia bacterium]